MPDRDITTDFEECYRQAESAWRPALAEMKKDLRFVEGDQLSPEEKQILRNQKRQPYIFNLQKKIVRLLTGYERKTRLSMIVGPEEGDRDAACFQHTKLLMHTMNRCASKAYQTFSDAFKFGSLMCGWNIVNFWPNHEGDIDFGRSPYNKFLLDPNFTNLDLSDCQYVILGDAITKEQAKRLVKPDLAKEIDKAFIKGTGVGDYGLSKWPFMTKKITPFKDDLRRFEQFWRRTTKKEKLLLNKTNMNFTPLKFILRPWMNEFEKRQTLFAIMNQPQFSLMDGEIDSVEMAVFYNGILLETYDDPYDIGDYPFVLIAGDWQPEEDDARYKIASLLRSTRDPQRAENRRMMQILDMAERQITTGWKFVEDAVANPESLYMAGTGVPIPIKKGHTLEEVKEIIAKDIPMGFMGLEQVVANKVMSLMGISEETFGAGEKDIPMGLWAMRQGASLTIFQEPFDNYRNARRQAGRKLVKMHQAVFSPQKVQRMAKEPIAPGFYEPDFEKYDCMLQEGILTDTQRQMAYSEVLQLRQMGITIPDNLIIELAPVQLSQRFKQAIAQQQAQQQQLQQIALQTQLKGAEAEVAVSMTKAQQQAAFARDADASAALDEAKTTVERIHAAKDLQAMQLEKINAVLDRLVQFEEISDRKLRREAIVKR